VLQGLISATTGCSADDKAQQHSAIFGHASPQFNLQVSSYPATHYLPDIYHSLKAETNRQSNAFCTYILCIPTTIFHSTIRTNHSSAALETDRTTTPNEAHGLRLHHLL
jgi:hypothetical protein